MHESFILRGGTVALPRLSVHADLVIEAGRSAAITAPGASEARLRHTVDVTGRIVLPGGVDVHTHLDSPSGTGHTTGTHRTGTIAAAVGGTTTTVDYAPQRRRDAFNFLHHRRPELYGSIGQSLSPPWPFNDTIAPKAESNDAGREK